ncbi:MAG: helix-turn-helix domain-containing protein [Nocardioides sp.]
MSDQTDENMCEDEIVEFDVPTDFGPLPRPVSVDPDPDAEDEPVVVEVRRRAGLAALIGVLAGGVATLYVTRAVDSGSALDWAVFGLFGLVALAYLGVLLDSRTPLLVADEQGLRLRNGRSWAGLTWGSLERVDVVERQGLRDGRLVASPREVDQSPLRVPLSLSTLVTGTDDLVASLRTLAADQTEVGAPLPTEPAEHHLPDPRPTLAHGISLMAARLRNGPVDEPAPDDVMVPTPAVVASATPSPLRSLVTGRRTEVTRELVSGANALKADVVSSDAAAGSLPEALVLRRPDLDDWDVVADEGVRPVALPGEALETIVIEDFAIEPADEPVIGPEFSAARSRLGLSVDQLAERTRIRPHVIESIEADDFVPCGGDFYARGHIRTLARILGIDAAPLLASYDEKYADAPVNPRRVFEAELAHSGGIRSTRGGPNWSVLVAAVMAIVLAWSIARLVMDGPVDLGNQPVLNGSGGPNHRGAAAAPAVPVVISAPGSGARVIVRDGAGTVVFNGDIAFGASKSLSVSPPVRIQASDGSVTVSVKGEDRGPLSTSGSPGSGTFVVR